MINIKNISNDVKKSILDQVTEFICHKYNCKSSEVDAKFAGDGSLKVTINPECITEFDCNIATTVVFGKY